MCLHSEDDVLNFLPVISRPQRNPMRTDTIEVMKKTVAEDTRAVVTLSHVPEYIVLLPAAICALLYIIHSSFIIESVDSISRDCPDTPIHEIHYK